MAARVLPHHKTNPYSQDDYGQNVVVLQAGGYDLSVLVNLSPPSLRCWMILAARLQPDGSSFVTLPELRQITGHPISTCNKGILELAHWRFITKRGLSRYWVNPRLCRVLRIK